MDYLSQFTIQFSGLANGIHQFEYQIEDKFFEELEYAVIERGNVHVTVEMEKSDTIITLQFKFNGEVEVNCDRCTVNYPYPVEGNHRLILQFGNEGDGDDDELVILPRNEFQFNVAGHIYEYLILALPLRVVPCEKTGDTSICDQSVITLLDQQPEDQPTTDTTPIDPRWEKLKNLSSDNDFNNDLK